MGNGKPEHPPTARSCWVETFMAAGVAGASGLKHRLVTAAVDAAETSTG